MSFPKFDGPKDPDDVSDHQLDFSASMPSDDLIATIDEVAITADKAGDPSTAADVSVESQLYSGQSAILWLSGGKPGWRYVVAALVQTVGGRTLRRRALLDVKPL